jgi:arginyl-tRNA synthetase
MTTLFRDQVAAFIAEGLRAAQQAGALPEFEAPEVTVERPHQSGYGDYASPVCLRLARQARMSPRDIAARVVQHLPSASFADKVDVAGPGYINVTLDHGWLAAQVEEILDTGERWGCVDVGRGKRVQVEFVSANPTGPIHIGSVRNAVIGDSLASVLAAAGYSVEREYYVNDAGSQVRKFGESIFACYAQALGQDEPFPEDGYRGHYVVEMGQQIAQQYGDRYLHMPRREAIRALGTEGIARVLDRARQDLADLGVEFDVWFHEKSLRESGLLDQALQMLRDKGHVVERDDAIWFTTPDLEADAVIIRSPKIIREPDERPTYLASDVAYVWSK